MSDSASNLPADRSPAPLGLRWILPRVALALTVSLAVAVAVAVHTGWDVHVLWMGFYGALWLPVVAYVARKYPH